MTLPRRVPYCPICGKLYAALATHLKRGHLVVNKEERSILLKMGTGRIQIRNEPCPVPGCPYQSTRLDKHIERGHPEMSTNKLRKVLEEAKKMKGLSLLAQLRVSDPYPPMASNLDIGTEERDDVVTGEKALEEACMGCIGLKKEVADLMGKVKVLEKELEDHQSGPSLRWARLMANRLRRVTPGLVEVSSDEDSSPEEQEEPARLEDPQQEQQQEVDLVPEQIQGPPRSVARPAKPATSSSSVAPGSSSSEKASPSKSSRHPTPRPSKSSSKPPTSSQEPGDFVMVFEGKGRASVLRKIVFPQSMEEYLGEYLMYQAGSATVGRQFETAQSKVSRVRCFLYYMAHNTKELWTWFFLDNPEGIRRWVANLQSLNRAVTTVNFYVWNVYQFLKYFQETKPKHCRLSKSQIVGVVRVVQKTLLDLRKKITLHQVRMKRIKMSRVVSAESLRSCREMAKAKMPKLLDALRADNCQSNRILFYGYFCAFVSSLYGHRPGVIANMLLEQVAEAEELGCVEEGYIINVDDHKTARRFGAAQLFLWPEEFQWLRDWVKMRDNASSPPPKANKLVFFTSGRGPAKHLNSYLRSAWKEMGLKGSPSFTDIRTAVSAYAKNVHTPEVRQTMTTYMCHETETADKFYSLSLSASQSREMREWFEATTSDASIRQMEARRVSSLRDAPKAAAADSSTPLKRQRKQKHVSSSSSGEEEEPPYEESDSTGLEEELQEMEGRLEHEGEEEEEETREKTPKKRRRLPVVEPSPLVMMTACPPELQQPADAQQMEPFQGDSQGQALSPAEGTVFPHPVQTINKPGGARGP